MNDSRLQRLADAVRERRQSLGMAQTDLAGKGGPGVVTVGKIERGEIKRPQASTLRSLDTALRWQPGSAAGVLQGQAPAELDENQQAPGAEIIAAIERETRLAPEVRKHLVSQVGLLLRLQEAGSSDAPMKPPPVVEVPTETPGLRIVAAAYNMTPEIAKELEVIAKRALEQERDADRRRATGG